MNAPLAGERRIDEVQACLAYFHWKIDGPHSRHLLCPRTTNLFLRISKAKNHRTVDRWVSIFLVIAAFQSTTRWVGGRQTAPVGSFAANGFGLYNVVGDEWKIASTTIATECRRWVSVDGKATAPTSSSATVPG
jgi:hypothetical protein